ncbi:hypothetical protein O9929_15870 [Vibrio lentus]|nr:hypothetical protein [Vibrio lentus]
MRPVEPTANIIPSTTCINSKRNTSSVIRQSHQLGYLSNRHLSTPEGKSGGGQGWNGMLILREGDKPVGWIAMDNYIHRSPIFTNCKSRCLNPLVLYAYESHPQTARTEHPHVCTQKYGGTVSLR